MLYTFIGDLADAPEVATTATGKTVTKIRFAVSDSYRDSEGKWQRTEAVWWNGEVWGSPAEAVRDAKLKSGQTVVVVGEIRSSSWEVDGEKRTRRYVSIREIAPGVISAARRKKSAKTAEPSQVESAEPVDAAGEWA